MSREEIIISKLTFLPMVLYGSYVSVKIAQIKAGSKQRKLNFFFPSS